MLRFRVLNKLERHEIEHLSGPFEFDRGPTRDDVPRCVLQDLYISKDHLRVLELEDGRVRSPSPETLAQWFETVIAVQRAAAGSPEFYSGRDSFEARTIRRGRILGLRTLRLRYPLINPRPPTTAPNT